METPALALESPREAREGLLLLPLLAAKIESILGAQMGVCGTLLASFVRLEHPWGRQRHHKGSPGRPTDAPEGSLETLVGVSRDPSGASLGRPGQPEAKRVSQTGPGHPKYHTIDDQKGRSGAVPEAPF